jgi:hypothetical protein
MFFNPDFADFHLKLKTVFKLVALELRIVIICYCMEEQKDSCNRSAKSMSVFEFKSRYNACIDKYFKTSKKRLH